MTARKMRNIVDEVTAPRSKEDVVEPRPNHFERRTRAIAQANETEAAVQVRVSPERCRIWAGNARSYESLTYARCEGLIRALISQGKQEIPAIGRRLRDDPDYDFEIIAGARRHWSVTWLRKNGYPDFKYFVEIRDIDTDEAAFRIGDIENRDREDVSAYERAVEYARALRDYYDGDRERMGHRLEIAKATLSRYLMLADLPELVLDAFPDRLSISLGHAQRLNPLLRDDAKRERLLAKATELAGDRERAGDEGRSGLSALEVMRVLEKVAKSGVPRTRQRLLPEFKSSEGEVVMRVESSTARGVRVFVPRRAALSEDEFLASCKALYRQMVE